MPTNRELEIIMKLKDEVSKKLHGIQGSLIRLSNSARQFGNDMRQVGRQISQVGTNMIYFGAAITGPMVLAFKQASEYSAPMLRVMYDMEDRFKDISRIIGEAILPIMHTFAEKLADIVTAFRDMDPDVRNHIIQTTFMAGVWLTVGGVLANVVGHVLTLAGGIAVLTAALLANSAVALPLLGIVAVIGLIVAAMWKWKSVANVVMNYFEGGANNIAGSFNFIKAIIQEVLSSAANMLARFYDLLGKLPGKLGQPYRDAAKAVHKWADDIGKTADETWVKTYKNFEKTSGLLQKTFKLQGGSWAEGFDRIKNKTIEFKGSIEDLVKTFETLKALADGSIGGGKQSGAKGRGRPGFWAGFEAGLVEAENKLKDFAATGKKVVQELVSAMQNMLSSFFFDFFTGQLKSAKEYFADFGRQILNSISQIIAQFIALKIVSSALGTFGIEFHSGGVIKAHSGYLARDEVPAILQTGEGVISRRGMAALGEGNLARLNRGDGLGGGTVIIQPVTVIKAWDATDMMRHKEEIKLIISEGITQNSHVRKIIKQYC